MSQFPSNIVIIGMRGVGKSSCGKMLSTRLNYLFVDTDSNIETISRTSIREIVERWGWEEFRKRETELLKRLILEEINNHVISCGGGIILKRENWELLKKLGKIFYLKAEPETIIKRMSYTDSRPPLIENINLEKEVRFLLKEREPIYIEVSDFIITTDNKTVEEVVYEMEQIWRTFQSSNFW